MNDAMRDEGLDREIRGFLAWHAEAVAGAPTATDVATRISSRVRATSARPRLAPQLVWIALVGLLVAGALGAAFVGARLIQGDPLGAYEAVFLRRGVDDPRETVVIAVDAEGHEREVTRLKDASMSPGPTAGVVSPQGLLAVPRSTDGWFFHWEIVDLLHPEAAPIVVEGIRQDAEQLQPTPFYQLDTRPGVFWGPDERLAIPWYERCPEASCSVDWQLTFVDGRTGSTRSVDVPEGDRIMPLWAADGSGVFVDRGDGLATTILGPDGAISDTDAEIAQTGYGRQYRADGNIARILDREAVLRLSREGVGVETLFSSQRTDVVDAAWTAAGDGVWLAIRSVPGDRDLRVERLASPSRSELVATIRDTEEGPSRLAGDFVSIAPDDSLIVLSVDRVTGTEDNGGREPVPAKALIAAGSGATFSVDGAFAGWLETTRSPVAPSPSPPPPSPSPATSPTSQLTERFDSPRNGLSIDYPSGWQVRPATEPWTGGALDFDSPAADVIFDPALEGRVYFALASLPRADIIVNRPPDGGLFSGNESDLMQRAGMPCDGGGGGRFTVDGFRAFDWQCHGPASVGILTPTRGYVIKLVVEEAGLLETSDVPSFGAVLETVDLRPEDASDAPSPSSVP